MSYILYINHVNEKARWHEDDCNRLQQHGEGGHRGEYRYFDDYDDV